MKKNRIMSIAVTVLLVAATWVAAQPDAPAPAKADPRIDKVIEQNDQILKNQQEIMKVLEQLKTDMNQLRRRTS